MCSTLVVRLLLVALILGLLPAVAPVAAQESKSDTFWVFIGTYTAGKSKGIYRAELDGATGKLSPPVLAIETTDPSFLAVDPTRRFLYAVGERKSGAINAFALDAKSGGLTVLNQQGSGGAGPCHLVVDKDGKHVLAANYGAGSVCVLPIQADGKLAEASCVIQHTGKGTDPKRQEAPHAHSINLDPAGRFAFAADLGLDKILIYRFDSATGKLSPNDPPAASVAAGAGPRHFAFHPSNRYAYVINELGNTITAFDYDAERGALATRQTITTLPKDFKASSYTAEVVVHPSGKFVYGSNRGHNSIAVFRVDDKGDLHAVGHQTHEIKWPRNFAIDPTGTYLLAGSEQGHRVNVFRIEPKTGELQPLGRVDVPVPVCIRFVAKG